MSTPGWRLVVAGPAVRDLDRLPPKYATAIRELLPAIAANPQRIGKPLRFELEGYRSARRGPYRVIYTIEEDAETVNVVAIGHRADVYRPR